MHFEDVLGVAEFVAVVFVVWVVEPDGFAEEVLFFRVSWLGLFASEKGISFPSG